jgi:hypothetical protein
VTYGGDSGNRIFVLYWWCPLIRGSTVVPVVVFCMFLLSDSPLWKESEKYLSI